MGMQGLASSRQGFVHSRQGFLGVGGPPGFLTDWWPDRRNRKILIGVSTAGVRTYELWDMDGGGHDVDVAIPAGTGSPKFADSPSSVFFASGGSILDVDVVGYDGIFVGTFTGTITTDGGGNYSYYYELNRINFDLGRMDGGLTGGYTKSFVTPYPGRTSNLVKRIILDDALSVSDGVKIVESEYNYEANPSGTGFGYTDTPTAYSINRALPGRNFINTGVNYGGVRNKLATRFPAAGENVVKVVDKDYGVLFSDPIRIVGHAGIKMYFSNSLWLFDLGGIYNIPYFTNDYVLFPFGMSLQYIRANYTKFINSVNLVPGRKVTSTPDKYLSQDGITTRYYLLTHPTTILTLPESMSTLYISQWYIEGDYLYYQTPHLTTSKIARINLDTFVTEDIVVL